jgi:uncharacterized membrane protein
MPFCPNCGASVDGRFCAKCGTAITAGGPGDSPTSSAPAAGTAMADNVASALCYVLGLITGILFLVLAPYNQNRSVRFHAFQSIFMHVAMIVIWFVLSFLFSITLHFFGALLIPLLWLAFFAVWLYMIISTYQGKKVVLPVIGGIAQQQA